MKVCLLGVIFLHRIARLYAVEDMFSALDSDLSLAVLRMLKKKKKDKLFSRSVSFFLHVWHIISVRIAYLCNSKERGKIGISTDAKTALSISERGFQCFLSLLQ